eukprot:COSAG05_NODE_2018_length_3687_cov_38.539091_5_plen_92_part_00
MHRAFQHAEDDEGEGLSHALAATSRANARLARLRSREQVWRPLFTQNCQLVMIYIYCHLNLLLSIQPEAFPTVFLDHVHNLQIHAVRAKFY